ncbi:hypothetical protein BN1012_Phect1971 [Candidatus Phaeomarinobacter ectocarpi]|uniref:Uncharacterized protein n=2 Tax=Candidatus Phaeomarinibacter ectocarpi TaxID=1458461 RepID=X5MFU6_9HYPH|nr:hypothetical protein BN1012_Phect1971 [Candidatus Phaeomarinobacter ectocarpi]
MVPLSATAQAGLFEAQAEETGRYTMEPVDGGFLRLDTQTGAVSVCSGSGDAWSCTPAQDERSKLEEENAQLRADNLALREQISELGEKPNVTTPEDVDAAMDAFETVAERFGRIIKIMRREMEELDQDLNAPADQDTDPAN